MNRARGFSLIELAIVLVIVTLLIGGLAVPLSAQIQARRIAETKQALNDAREALIGYAMTHRTSNRPFLPCPDSTVPPDGVEDRVSANGPCAQDVGWFPWVTLGTAAQDAWGTRLGYHVTPVFSDGNGFLRTDQGSLQVCSAAGCTVTDVAQNVPAIVFSHGANSWGGRNVSGSALNAPTSADELENSNADINYVSRPPTPASNASGEFDDLLVWLPADVLRPRVCGPLPDCP